MFKNALKNAVKKLQLYNIIKKIISINFYIYKHNLIFFIFIYLYKYILKFLLTCSLNI